MQPRKDYDDYTKFINDTYTDEKINMLNKTVDLESKRGSFKGGKPTETLRTYSEFPTRPPVTDRLADGKHSRSLSLKPQTETEKKMGSTFVDFNVKPKILESKIS